MNRNAKASFWASVARLIGVVAGSGAGSTIHQMIGGGMTGWPVVAFMLVGAFFLTWYSEFSRERVKDSSELLPQHRQENKKSSEPALKNT